MKMMRKSRHASNTEITRTTSTGLRLTILIDDDDTWHHRPLFTEIVHRAHQDGLAGASVFHGIEGFGASSVIHTNRLLSMTEDLPVAVVIIDTPDRIRAFLPRLDELAIEGLVTIEEVDVVRFEPCTPCTRIVSETIRLDDVASSPQPGHTAASS